MVGNQYWDFNCFDAVINHLKQVTAENVAKPDCRFTIVYSCRSNEWTVDFIKTIITLTEQVRIHDLVKGGPQLLRPKVADVAK